MKYFDLFTSIESVHEQWNGSSDVTDAEVLFAVYSYEGYSGEAFLVYERNGVLYEVHDAHCSCHGLDNWVPEETHWRGLRGRDFSGYGLEAAKFLSDLVSSKIL